MKARNVVSARRGALRVLAAGAATMSLPLRAQTAKAIRMILPFSAGGPTDSVARSIAASLSSQLGQPFAAENRTGANGVIASELVARSPADGNTLLYHTSAFSLAAAVGKNLPFDPLRDFSYVGMTTSTPLVLLVHPDFPARTPAEFIAQLKANPGKFSYGAVLRSIVHVAPEQLFHALGVKAVVVPYRGTAPAVVDLMGGQLQFAFDAVNSALPHIRSGRVRAIAMASLQRSPLLPEVATLAESVLPGFEAGTWGGILAPAGTPPETIARIHKALSATLADPGFRSQLEAQGLRIVGGSPEQFFAFVRDEIARWKQVVGSAKIPLE